MGLSHPLAPGADVLPTLVNACSAACVNALSAGTENHSRVSPWRITSGPAGRTVVRRVLIRSGSERRTSGYVRLASPLHLHPSMFTFSQRFTLVLLTAIGATACVADNIADEDEALAADEAEVLSPFEFDLRSFSDPQIPAARVFKENGVTVGSALLEYLVENGVQGALLSASNLSDRTRTFSVASLSVGCKPPGRAKIIREDPLTVGEKTRKVTLAPGQSTSMKLKCLANETYVNGGANGSLVPKL